MTRDRREIDIEALLEEAGARWRSLQPAAPEPTWHEETSHGLAYLAAGGVAAAAVLVAIAAVGLLSMRPIEMGQETAVPGGQASPSPEDQMSSWVVREGDTVVASGQVFLRPDGEEPVLCRLGPVLLISNFTPQCPRVQVALSGLDLTTLPGWKQFGDTGVWLSSDVRVTGTWRAGKLEVSDVVSSPAPPYFPDPGVVPCPAPDTGWPGNGDIDAAEAATERLDAEIAAHPELYSGMWWAWIGTARSGPRAVVVGTTGDVAAVRSKLEEIYPFDLCVVEARFSRSELDAAAEQISGLNASWQVRVDQPYEKVLVQLVLVDEEAAKLLEPYREKVELDPLVTRAD